MSERGAHSGGGGIEGEVSTAAEPLAGSAGSSSHDARTAGPIPTRTSWWHRHRPGPRTLWPLAVLVVADVIVWARVALPHFATLRLSNPGDSESFAFYLAWNLHAFTHGLNPFHTPFLYAPYGEDLGNGITMPAIGIVVSPVTAIWGGTAGYNVAFLLGMLSAGWAVFLLAREFTGDAVAGTVAGLLMMVSPYLVEHSLGHLNLLWVFGLPYLAYLVIRLYRGTISRGWAVAGIALIFVVTAGASTELTATQTLFAAIAFVVAVAFLPPPGRRRLVRTLPTLALGGVIGAVLASPIIYAAFHGGRPTIAPGAPGGYSADLTNLITATGQNQFPLGQRLAALTQFHSNVTENTAWIPIPLLIFLIGYPLLRRTRLTTGLVVFAAIALILSFGPRLPINGTRTIPMPWALVTNLPVVDAVLPNRFTCFVFIALLVVVADAWVAVRKMPRAVTAVVVVVSFLMLYPSASRSRFPVDAANEHFVTSGQLEARIDPGENVLVLPGGQKGPGMRWVEVSRFYFRTATGNGGGGNRPVGLKDPTARAIYRTDLTYDYRAALVPYLRKIGVRKVFVPASFPEWKQAMDRALPVPAQRIDDVWMYELP